LSSQPAAKGAAEGENIIATVKWWKRQPHAIIQFDCDFAVGIQAARSRVK